MGTISQYMGSFLFELLVLLTPVLVIAVIVGLVVAIFQTVTSIQEQTLSFVPKLFAIFLTLWLLGSWMLGRLIGFSQNLFQQIGM